MANEDIKTGGVPLLPPPPPLEPASLRSRGAGKDIPIYISPGAPAEGVRRSKSSGCWICGCDADHDVIPPSSSTTTTKASPGTTNSLNRVTDHAPDLFPPGAGAVVDYLKTHGFTSGLLKSLVNLEVRPTNPPFSSLYSPAYLPYSYCWSTIRYWSQFLGASLSSTAAHKRRRPTSLLRPTALLCRRHRHRLRLIGR